MSNPYEGVDFYNIDALLTEEREVRIILMSGSRTDFLSRPNNWTVSHRDTLCQWYVSKRTGQSSEKHALGCKLKGLWMSWDV